jgi:hypothetical protein
MVSACSLGAALTSEQRELLAEHRQLVASLVEGTARSNYESPGPAERRLETFRTLLNGRIGAQGCQVQFRDFGAGKNSVQIYGSGCGVSLNREGRYLGYGASAGMAMFLDAHADLNFRYSARDQEFLNALPLSAVSIAMNVQGMAGSWHKAGAV